MTSTSTSLTPLDKFRRFCIGAAQHYPGPYPSGYWGSPFGGDGSTDSRCGFCRQVLQLDQSMQCSTLNDFSVSGHPRLFETEFGGFKVGLSVPQHKTPLYLVPSERSKVAAGVGIYCAPTQCEYEINIKSGYGICFRILSAQVGDKIVKINNGEEIYYSNKAIISGFETGKAKSSFLFYSPSDYETKNLQEDIPADLNSSNIIKLKLQHYKRITVPEPAVYLSRSTNSNRDFGASRGGSWGFECAPTLQSASRGWSGGATKAGGSYVDNVRTSTTRDRFEAIGTPVEIQLQLVCFQSDKEKMVDNLSNKLEGFNKLKTERVSLLNDIQNLREQINRKEARAIEVEFRFEEIKSQHAHLINLLGEPQQQQSSLLMQF